MRQVYEVDGESLQAQNVSFDVSFLLGGQIAGGPLRLFQIYAAGNFIESDRDMPFLQIGEHKYGKPILDRALSHDTPLEDGVKLVLVSMDSTLRSNLTVGLPIDLLVLREGALKIERQRRITEDDPYFRMIRERWSSALREAFQSIPGRAGSERGARPDRGDGRGRGRLLLRRAARAGGTRGHADRARGARRRDSRRGPAHGDANLRRARHGEREHRGLHGFGRRARAVLRQVHR